MTDVIDDIGEVPDELTSLKARADLMGITYHPNIGVEKLRDKINAAVTATSDEVAPEEVASVVVDETAETESQMRARLRREANELVFIRLTCMNPAKKEWEGEIISTGNSVVGSFTKFVPFNADNGWHVPRIIYEQLAQRQCQIFTSSRDERGNTIRKNKLIKEFAIEVLPPMTLEELEELARRQAMAKSID